MSETNALFQNSALSIFPAMLRVTIGFEGVATLLQSTKSHKSTGPDSIQARIQNEAAVDFAPMLALFPMLALLFQASLDKGMVLDDYKTANVVPIFKKGNWFIPLNYRPILLTFICSKIMQHVIGSNIAKHLKFTPYPHRLPLQIPEAKYGPVKVNYHHHQWSGIRAHWQGAVRSHSARLRKTIWQSSAKAIAAEGRKVLCPRKHAGMDSFPSRTWNWRSGTRKPTSSPTNVASWFYKTPYSHHPYSASTSTFIQVSSKLEGCLQTTQLCTGA